MMFSFHKPKIYRSGNGCCICKAKSSSSRFTDSKKYEPEFEHCFKITEKRSGEICNACVLLVKRWKKLPPGTTRNWSHVVDGRAGPGTKSMMKCKSKSKLSKRSSKMNKIKRILKRSSTPPLPPSPGGLSDDITVGEECLSDQSSSSIPPSPTFSDESEDSFPTPTIKSKICKPKKLKVCSSPKKFSAFVDMNIWKKEKVCCGIVFMGPGGGVIIDQRLFRPCRTCKKRSTSSGDENVTSSSQSSDSLENNTTNNNNNNHAQTLVMTPSHFY